MHQNWTVCFPLLVIKYKNVFENQKINPAMFYLPHGTSSHMTPEYLLDPSFSWLYGRSPEEDTAICLLEPLC